MLTTKKILTRKVCISIAVSLLILLFGFEFFLGYYCYKKSQEPVSFTQLSPSAPMNKENKTYVVFSQQRGWHENGQNHYEIYNNLIVNHTEKDFCNWSIKLKIPEGTKIVSHWNCYAELKDEYMYLSGDTQVDKIIAKNSSIAFGFVLELPDSFRIKTISYSGNYKYELSSFKIHHINMLLILIDITALFISMIVHNVMQKRINNLKLLKSRDNAIIEQTMRTFVNFIDAKDEYTRGHSTRVAKYSRQLAKQMGFDEEFQQDIFYMGLMHDIGKITVPDNILNKTSHLSDNEWEIIQMHTKNGAKLLEDFTIMPSIKDAVLYHHERYDGKGYIYQLKGEDIPIAARIICVADSFDAMNTTRCYRLKYSHDRIIQEFERCSGKQFDPVVAKAMIELLKENKLETTDNDYQ